MSRVVLDKICIGFDFPTRKFIYKDAQGNITYDFIYYDSPASNINQFAAINLGGQNNEEL